MPLKSLEVTFSLVFERVPSQNASMDQGQGEQADANGLLAPAPDLLGSGMGHRIWLGPLAFLLLVGTPVKALAQQLENAQLDHQHDPLLITFMPSVQYGAVLPTNKFIRGDNLDATAIDRISGLSLRIGHQSSGPEPWKQQYGYPIYGIGFSAFRFNDPSQLGSPFTLHGFFSAPLVHSPKFLLNMDVALGVAFNWKPFDPVYNPSNISIGAKESAYIGIGAHVAYRLAPKLNALLGLEFSHFSNGALKAPNYGVNAVSPTLGLGYQFFTWQRPPKMPRDKGFDRKPTIDLDFFYGVKNVIYDTLRIDLIEKYEGVNFSAYGLQACVSQHISFKSKLGLGLTLDHNGAHDAQVSVNNGDADVVPSSFAEKLQLSIYPSYELVINRVSLLLQPSFYLVRTKEAGNTPVFYQRIGIRYHPTSCLYVGVSLRSYQFDISEFLEWNVGFTFGTGNGGAKNR
ncbi:MAG: acyloxyacyl hydrolase [Flavobacteriales bacterium]